MSKTGKIRLLITDTAPLYPPLWGGPKRIWNLFGNLPEDTFDITYVGSVFGLEGGLQYSFRKIKNNFREISCQPAPHYYAWHFLEKALFKDSNLDLFVYLAMNTDWQFVSRIGLREADCIVCSHPWSSPCIRKKKGQFFIYDAHNCEYLLMDRILGRHPLKGVVLSRVRKIERDACRKSDLILACSDKEKQDLVGLYKVDPSKIMITTNGSDVREATIPRQKEDCRRIIGLPGDAKVVVFVGAYYKPNIDAARFIMQEIAWKMPSFHFLLIGTIADAFRDQSIPPNVRLLGRVSDEQLETALRASDAAINPMFDGSGTNIKMLDYMAYGLPIITTETGSRGIATFGRTPMRLAAADDFCAQIQKLFADQESMAGLGKEGPRLIAEHYNWKTISASLEKAIVEGMSRRA